MGGHTGVRRDVLRWLVALRLSYPIKNMKRDFSNGFLVAEIFSRYFPHDVQMHSYDYGTKMEKKRDNWTQLQKFFKKRSFVVMKDEIETIITCQTPDGAVPLLERMYKFLTMKRCKPEEAAAEKMEQQMQQDWKPDFELTTNSSVPVPPRVDFSQFPRGSDFEGNCTELANLTSIIHSAGNNDAESTSFVCSCITQENLCSNPFCQNFISESNALYSLQQVAAEPVPGQEESSGVLLPLESNVNFSNCDDDNQFDKTDDSRFQRINCGGENQNINKGLSAVERARRRECGVHDSSSQPKMLNGDHIETIKPRSKTPSNVALAFRSPHRQREFKQYTISDYRRQQTAGCVPLGKLGPDFEDEELSEKREKLKRMKMFARIVRSCNTAQMNVPKKTKRPPLSNRQKALEFAATVPKPKVKKIEVEKPSTPEKSHHLLSELEILEAKHAADRQHVEAIRRELEIFLR